MCVRERGGSWEGLSQCWMAFQFHTVSPVMGLKLHPLFGKWSLNNLFQEGLVGEGAYIIDLNYAFPNHESWVNQMRNLFFSLSYKHFKELYFSYYSIKLYIE